MANLFNGWAKDIMDEPIGLSEFTIFDGFTDHEWQTLLQVSEGKSFEARQIIFKEGDISDQLYIILKGKIRISKADDNKKEFPIETLHAIDVFGDLSFIDGHPRSANARAVNHAEIMVISKSTLLHAGEIGVAIYGKLVSNIAKIASSRLRQSNINYVETLRAQNMHLQLRTEFGKFFLIIITIFGLANVVDQFLVEYYAISIPSQLFNWVYLLVIISPISYFLLHYHYRLNEFGITTKNLKRSILDGLIASVIILLGAQILFFIIGKVANISFAYNPNVFRVSFLLYFLHAYIQELAARGVGQTALQRFYDDKKGNLSIVMASYIFAVLHLHQGIESSLVIFFASLIFGKIYLRTYNLAGVTIFHFFTGAVGYYYGITG